MSKRSSWCEFSNDERKYMKKRENGRCFLCGEKAPLEAMHIFINRSHGGRGIRTNGVMGCCLCHRVMDNPIGSKENELSKEYQKRCKEYLVKKENIKDIELLKKELVYHKEKNNFTFNKVEPKSVIIKVDNCKTCKNSIKMTNHNSTIPFYYCKFKSYLNKKTGGCVRYENRCVNKQV